ncbi:MAG: CCA tRNA nucleotidyltransferase [Cyanobacteria bacterium J06638_20]
MNTSLNCTASTVLPVASASVLSPQTWPFSLDWLPMDAYLVGGNVRDALLGRKAEYLDLDFVMPSQAVETAQKIAQHYQAGYVVLDSDRQIARVVFDRATVDFAQQVGDSLDADLHRRDFTVNAIAYHPHTHQLVDPLQGYDDLRRQQICMIAPENLKDDPLRLLRAYRQSAQLGFTLDAATQETIQDLADLLSQVAPERVQAELNYLLGTAAGTQRLATAWHDRLLAHWLPHSTRRGLERIADIDNATAQLCDRYPAFVAELTNWLKDQQKVSGMGRSWLRVAKLTCLVSENPTLAEQELWTLKYSRLEVQAVLTVLRSLTLLPEIANQPSRRAQYYFFRKVGNTFPALVVRGMAEGLSLEAIAPLIDRFLNPDDPVAYPKPLVSGRELMQALNLRPSPRVGRLLEAIQLAQAEGVVGDRTAAIQFAKRYAEEGAFVN